MALSRQRPTANELLQHRFIRGARKTSYLTELIERYQDYRSRSPQKGQQTYQPSVRNSVAWDSNGTMKSDWNFDTIKSTAAMGTFRTMAKDLAMPAHMEADDDDMSVYEEDRPSIDTSGATNGSDLVGGGLGLNSQAAHSTVVIKPSRPAPEIDMEMLLASGSSSPDQISSGSPATPPDGAPPAYTGSIRSKRRASYAERTSARGAGTILNEADLGTGVDTIRPVKKVDPVGSLRISAEFVGNLRREGSGSTPTSPTTSPTTHTRRASDAGKAGKAMVDEVVLPILRKVCAEDVRLCW
jgi:serine/threonine-protein kinase 24/25/MST4